MTPPTDAEGGEEGMCEICGEREATATVADGNEVCADCATMFGSARSDHGSDGSLPRSDADDSTSTPPHDRVAARLRGTDLDPEEHFIDVHDGEKRSTVPHTDSSNRHGPDGVTGNYGIYATGDEPGGLVALDVDDYDDDVGPDALISINGLSATLTVETPHTDGEEGGHSLYAVVPGEEFETAQDALEAVTGNTKTASPTWGDIRVANGYVVGPGSQLDGCDKEWCDECTTSDGGWYKIAADRPIATITADKFADLLRADPKYQQTDAWEDEYADTDGGADARGSRTGTENPTRIRADSDGRADADLSDEELLERARNAKNGQKFSRLWSGDTSGYTSHSEAQQALANLLAFWTGGDERRMLDLFRRSDMCRGDDDIRTFENYEIPKALKGRTADDFYDPDAADPAKNAPNCLTYQVIDADGADVELRLVPINGTQVRVDIAQNDSVEYSERRDRGFWDSSHIRAEIGNEVADRLTGVDDDAVADGVRAALTQASIDADKDSETFAVALRSQRERELHARTVSVESYPAAGDGEWVVTMRPPDGSSVNEPQDLRFSAGDLLDGNAGAFRTAHITAFQTKVALDAAEWGGLTDYWLDVATVHERDPDHLRDAAVESFIEWVSTIPVWGDEEGFEWGGQNGFYDEDFDGDSDAVLVPGRVVVDWKQRKDFGDVNLSRALREEDVLLGASDFVTIRGDQYKAWPVDADVTPHNLDNVARTPDAEDDGEAATNTTDDGPPEGLRG